MEFTGKYMSTDTDNAGRRRRGRPPTSPDRARSHRVVTFVTEAEYLQLEEIAVREDRSLASVLYRIVSKHLG